MHQPLDEPHDETPFTPDQHFLPDYHDCPDFGEEVTSRIEVPIHKKPLKTFFEERPHDVLAATWSWVDDWGPYTKERFAIDAQVAVKNMVEQINEMNRLVCYPISHEPGVQYGKAYHDWKGASYPVDIRFVIVYANDILVDAVNEAGEPVQVAKRGLKFHLTTLVDRSYLGDDEEGEDECPKDQKTE